MITWVEIFIVAVAVACIAIAYTLVWVYCATNVALAISVGMLITFLTVFLCGAFWGMYVERH